MRSGTRSPSVTSSPVYSRGTSADQGSTGTVTLSPVAMSMPSSATVTRPSTSESTFRVPVPARWS